MCVVFYVHTELMGANKPETVSAVVISLFEYMFYVLSIVCVCVCVCVSAFIRAACA